MEQVFERAVGSARRESTKISNWYIRAIISISAFFLPCKKTDGQSLELNKSQLSTYTFKQDDLKIQPLSDFRIASSCRSQAVLLKNALREGSENNAASKPSSPKKSKIKNDQFLMDMNCKLDSAWRKFDQRCRARDKLLSQSF